MKAHQLKPSRRHCLGLPGLVLFALMAVAVPETAQAQMWIEETGQGWFVGRSDDECLMRMDYEGEGATRLDIFYLGEKDLSHMSLVNYNWSIGDGEKVGLSFYIGDRGWESDSVGVSIDYRKGFITTVDEDFLDAFAAGNSLIVLKGEALVDSLSLAGSAVARTHFERCRRQVQKMVAQRRKVRDRLAGIPVDPFKKPEDILLPRPAMPIGDPSLWVSVADYPARSLRLAERGVTGVSLTISRYGRVINCDVVSSSGYVALDDQTCLSLMRRGRFEPAIGEDGKVIEGEFSTAIQWSLP